MRFLCVHCDHRFEAEDKPRRCPSCMRATGVEEVGAPGAAPARRSAWVLWGCAAGLIVALVGGYVWWATRSPEITDEVPLRPLSTEELEAHLERLGVDPGELRGLLRADEAVARFAEHAARGGGEPAQAVYRALRARAAASAFVPWGLGEPRPGDVLLPGGGLEKVREDKARAELYPLEVAALMVAALRSLEVTALVAELRDLEGEPAPLDGSGYLGYFAVAVYPDEEARGAARLYDPFGGRNLDAAKVGWAALDDLAAVGAALSLRGIFEVADRNDPKRALATSSSAIALAGRLPSVRGARGVVLLASGSVERALAELEAARQLRPDAPRLHMLASAALLTRDLSGANANLTKALALKPEYANARVTLALVHLHEGDSDKALAELKRAARLAPKLSLVDRAFAEYYAAEGELPRALEHARRAVARRPTSEGRLQLGRLYRLAGQYDAMREQAQAMLAAAPAYRHDELRVALTRVLGPTAFEDDSDLDEPAEGAREEPAVGGEPPLGRLRLGEGSRLLSDERDEGKLKLRSAGEGGPLLLLGDPSKLRLRDEDERLQLKLDP